DPLGQRRPRGAPGAALLVGDRMVDEIAPVGRPIDHGEARLGRDLCQLVAVGRVEPFAAEIERKAAPALDGPGPAADAVARLDQENAHPALEKPPRCRDAGGAGADDDAVETAQLRSPRRPASVSRACSRCSGVMWLPTAFKAAMSTARSSV